MIDFKSLGPRDEEMTLFFKIHFGQLFLFKMAAKMATGDKEMALSPLILHIGQ